MSAEVELRMLEGSEFQTVGAAMLKLREAKVVRTRVPVSYTHLTLPTILRV